MKLSLEQRITRLEKLVLDMLARHQELHERHITLAEEMVKTLRTQSWRIKELERELHDSR